MAINRARRHFLADVGRGTLVAAIGSSLAIDLGLVSASFPETLDGTLTFGKLEPLVCEMQDTPLPQLQESLVKKLQNGIDLKTLVAAGALANARTFGGEDYVGFHTFMALAPALRLAGLMPRDAAPLPVLKVLYRNTDRIQAFGSRSAEVLHAVNAEGASGSEEETLHSAIKTQDVHRAEQRLAELVALDPHRAFDALLPSVQDNPEVHRTVLPFRAWEMQELVGTEHALTLLRQSLRYCVRAESSIRSQGSPQGDILVRLIDEFRLTGAKRGTRDADDSTMEQLSRTIAESSPEEAARAAASALADGFAPKTVGEALSLAATQLVLRDGGRLPQWEDRLKTAGSVHGDSMGVHASDAANAWRNLARIASGQNETACLILGAWQVARDRDRPGNLLAEPLPPKYQIDRLPAASVEVLLTQLKEAIQDRLQSHATAIVHRLGSLEVSPESVFHVLAEYAVSQDGALHAEKYFQTVWDDFHATRPSLRWRHLMSLARVTASEYGTPAAGQQEAVELLRRG